MRVVRHDHTRHVDPTEIAPEIFVVAAEKQNAARLSLPAQLRRPPDLVVVFIDEVGDDGVVGVRKERLELFHHRREHLVGCALDNDENALCPLLLE